MNEYGRGDERRWAMKHFKSKTWRRRYYQVDYQFAQKYSDYAVETLHNILEQKLAFPLQFTKIKELAVTRECAQLAEMPVRDLVELVHFLKVIRFRRAQLKEAGFVRFEKKRKNHYAVFTNKKV